MLICCSILYKRPEETNKAKFDHCFFYKKSKMKRAGGGTRGRIVKPKPLKRDSLSTPIMRGSSSSTQATQRTEVFNYSVSNP